jgi:chitin disaccharide deacetylase
MQVLNKKNKQRVQHRLIVNADDFGGSALHNTAIMQAHLNGILTSTSLMVTGDAFAQAVELARATPSLRIGLHITLLQDRPCLPASQIPDLVCGGRFMPDPLTASRHWLTRPAARRQILFEVRAQLERFLETGLPLDHINGHFHFHIHPWIFSALMELMEEYGLTHYVRIPTEPLWPALALDRSSLLRKVGYIAKFNLPSLYYRLHLHKRGLPTIDGVLGLFQTGHITTQYLVQLLERAPVGTYELYAHPRLNSVKALGELNALTAPEVRDVIKARNIRLTTYSQLDEPDSQLVKSHTPDMITGAIR